MNLPVTKGRFLDLIPFLESAFVEASLMRATRSNPPGSGPAVGRKGMDCTLSQPEAGEVVKVRPAVICRWGWVRGGGWMFSG